MQCPPNEPADLGVFSLQLLNRLLQFDQLRLGCLDNNRAGIRIPVEWQVLEIGGKGELQREPALLAVSHPLGQTSSGSGQDVVPGQRLRPAQFGQMGVNERGGVFVLAHLQTPGHRRVQVRQRRS
jgi:hypothetical protein